MPGLYVNYYKAFLKDRQFKFVWKEHMVMQNQKWDGGKRSFYYSKLGLCRNAQAPGKRNSSLGKGVGKKRPRFQTLHGS
jgi:hypothetical protein